MSSKVYIVEAARLPIGKYGGMYSDVGPEELGGLLMKTMLNKHPEKKKKKATSFPAKPTPKSSPT